MFGEMLVFFDTRPGASVEEKRVKQGMFFLLFYGILK